MFIAAVLTERAKRITIQATRGERYVEKHGIAAIYETWEHGEHIGYRITCCRHSNGPTDKLPCQKHLPFGTGRVQLDKNECIRRLKRWFVVGNTPTSESLYRPDVQRTDHVSLGGRRLNDYRSDGGILADICDDDLNLMCTTTVA